jgi:hypothetical protein
MGVLVLPLFYIIPIIFPCYLLAMCFELFHMYSKTILVYYVRQNSANLTHTGPNRLNILCNQIVLYLTGNFLLLFLYLGCADNQIMPFWYLLHLLVQGQLAPLLCFLESL